MINCIKCGDTGITVDGTKCDCKAGEMKLPIVLDIPNIYQVGDFSASLVPVRMPKSYGIDLEDIISVIKNRGSYNLNLLICSTPNTGKTVFAYTIFKSQYLKGLPMPEIIDLVEARELIMTNNYYDENFIKEKDKLITSKIAVIKIPLDLPNKFSETMSSIVERRVRKNGITIFLYGNNIDNLLSQDKYGTLNNIIRDGSYNSLKVMNYTYMD